jgi:hypothetical protein|tara:strand:+ start:1277 stop:1636 length:360 start_codon:yes stop_codon:yes gene_type:complete
MVASDTNVQYLLGELYDAMGTDKATIVTAMVARAQNYVDSYTGSKTGNLVDNAVESYATLYCLQRMVAGSNSANSISIGSINIGAKQIQTQISELRTQGKEQLAMVGRSTGSTFKLTTE